MTEYDAFEPELVEQTQEEKANEFEQLRREALREVSEDSERKVYVGEIADLASEIKSDDLRSQAQIVLAEQYARTEQYSESRDTAGAIPEFLYRVEALARVAKATGFSKISKELALLPVNATHM